MGGRNPAWRTQGEESVHDELRRADGRAEAETEGVTTNTSMNYKELMVELKLRHKE